MARYWSSKAINGPADAVDMTGLRLLTIVLVAVALMAAAAAPALSARRALLVGLEEYEEPGNSLKGVREDVRLFREALIKNGAFSPDEIKTLIDKEATKEKILSVFQEWLLNGTQPGDTALFYFSGHGIQIWDENGDEVQDGLDEALMTWDAKLLSGKVAKDFQGRPQSAFTLNGAKNFILDDEIGELFKRMNGRKVVFISDSCHSGSVYKNVNTRLVQYKTPGSQAYYKSPWTPRLAGKKAVIRENTNIGGDLEVNGAQTAVFTASEDSQPAAIIMFEKEPTGVHSVFTWYLINGLAGKADLDHDGKISYGELAKFLSDEIARDDHAQMPQHHFLPKSLEGEVFAAGTRGEKGQLRRPDRIFCHLKTEAAISSEEREKIKYALSSKIPPLAWVDDSSKASCMIEVDKSGSKYVARLSDSSGTWESHEAPSLDTALSSIMKDIRALYVQLCMSSLRNANTRMALDLDHEVKGNPPRTKGEVVRGDALLFRAKAQTPGYLYMFNVDTTGVIHPLYPGRDGVAPKAGSGTYAAIGEDYCVSVHAPFGKEMIYAILSDRPLESLARLWSKDEIGDEKRDWLTDQSDFIEMLWKELTDSGKPKGDWISRVWWLKSFASSR